MSTLSSISLKMLREDLRKRAISLWKYPNPYLAGISAFTTTYLSAGQNVLLPLLQGELLGKAEKAAVRRHFDGNDEAPL